MSGTVAKARLLNEGFPSPAQEDGDRAWREALPALRAHWHEHLWRQGIIYFVIVGHGKATRVKVGWTQSHPRRRLQALQIGHPEALGLVGCLPGSRADEAALHRRMAPYRDRGEWFALNDELVGLLEICHEARHYEPSDDPEWAVAVSECEYCQLRPGADAE